jgi:hypothetical protein
MVGDIKSSRLLQKARDSKAGWVRSDIDKLYKAFGFIILSGNKHDIVKHEANPSLRATLTRSSGELHKDYIRHAVKMIEELLELEGERDE